METANGKVAISEVSVFVVGFCWLSCRWLETGMWLIYAKKGGMKYRRSLRYHNWDIRGRTEIKGFHVWGKSHTKRYNSGNEDSPKLRGQKPQRKIYIFSSVSSCALYSPHRKRAPAKKLRYFIPKNVRLNCDL